MKVKNIMTPDVVSVAPETNILDVAEILFSNRFHGLPVLKDEEVVGIITEDDFFLKNFDDLFLPSYISFLKEKRIAENLPEEIKSKIKRLSEAKARDIMTKDCISVSPDMDVPALMELIKKTAFTTFPVVDQGQKILGVVTLADILGIIKKNSREMKRKLEKGTPATKLNRLIGDLNLFWNDQLVVMTKKKVKTWKGMFFIATLVAAGVIILFFANLGTGSSCSLEEKSVYPLECKRFTYSDWSQCRADGTQTRSIIEGLPKNCEGGSPEIFRPCQ